MTCDSLVRPDWDHYWLKIAEDVALRATCNRAHAGGVVTDKDHCVLVTGYNGAPAGAPHCPTDEDLAPEAHCSRVLHVENNIVVQAARRGVSLAGAIWYFWPFGPCVNCQKNYIVPTKASRVVFPICVNLPFKQDYIDVGRLRQAGIQVVML